MKIVPCSGTPGETARSVDMPGLVMAGSAGASDASVPEQWVTIGLSGHRVFTGLNYSIGYAVGGEE
jgi:hypothetical protein